MPQSNPSQAPSGDPRHQFHEIVVAQVIRETDDASSFVFEVPSALASLFHYKPGQFLTLQIPWESFEIKRCYSLSSTPSWGESPKVTVKRVEGGRMSNWLNDRLEQGDRLQVMPPAGQFVLHDFDRPLFLFAGGSGITPVISILKEALSETTRKLKMVYANRDADSVIFKRELADIASRFRDRLELVHHDDSLSGLLDAAGIRQHIEGFLGGDFYICGPTPFMDVIEEVLHECPHEGAVHIERFVSAIDPDHAVARPEAPAVVAGVPEKVAIILDGTRHEIAYQEGETLLQAALRAGLDVPFSCQDGYCSCCMSKLNAGEVFMATHDALSKGEVSDGWILACQAKPTTGVIEIEFTDE